MATYAITTSQNYTAVNGGTFNDFDRLTVSQGAQLLINTDTNIVERFLCTTIGSVRIENTSTTTPIFIKTGDNSAATNAQIRFEGDGQLIVRGDWIDLGTSDGTSGQTFTTPQNANSESLESLPTLFVFPTGATEPLIYNRVDSFDDCFGVFEYGSVFTYDVPTRTITFGDGFEGHIPENGAVIKMPNICFFEHSLNAQYTDFDLATSGVIDLDKCMFGINYAHNYSSASQLTIKNVGYDHGRELFNWGSNQNPVVENCGVLVNFSATGGIQMSAVNNATLTNVFIYNILVNTNYHGFYLVNGANIELTRCRAVAPLQPYSTSRGTFYINSASVNLTECASATAGVGLYYAAGSANAKVVDFKFNKSGSRIEPTNTSYGIYVLNAGNFVFQRCSSYPLDAADGAFASNNYPIILNSGSANCTFDDCDIYCGPTAGTIRANNLLLSNGADHRLNNIRIHGHPSGDTINHSTASIGMKASNITYVDPPNNTLDIEWTDECEYDLVATADQLDAAPTASGANVATFHLRLDDSDTLGRLYYMFGKDTKLGLQEELVKTGDIFFNNAGRLYMNTAGDKISLQSHVHTGITALGVTDISGSGTGNFTVTFQLRTPDGTYGTERGFTTANVATSFSELVNYDHNTGLQFKFIVERDVSNVTDYLTDINVRTTISPGYQVPFVLTPATITLADITPGSIVLIYDLSNADPQHLGQELFRDNNSSATATYTYDGDVGGQVQIQVIDSPDYKIYSTEVTLPQSNSTISIKQQPETN